MHPLPSPARANFTLMTECSPESSGCYSVYSVVASLATPLGQMVETPLASGGEGGGGPNSDDGTDTLVLRVYIIIPLRYIG